MSIVNDITGIVSAENDGHHVFVLPGSGEEIQIKPLSVGNYKQFQKTAESLHESKNPDLFKLEEVFDNVLSKCITKPVNYDVKNMYSSDWTYLMYMLRSVSKSSIVKFSGNCKNQECGEKITTSIDLNELENIKPREKFFEYKFNDNLTIMLTAAVRKNDYEIKRSRGNYTVDSEYEVYKIASLISKIEYKTPEMDVPKLEESLGLVDKVNIIKSLSADQLKDINKIIEKNLTWGLPITYDIKCKHCGNTQKELVLELSDFFLV